MLKKALGLTCGSSSFASVDTLSWVIGVPGYYTWMDETFYFFPVLYSPPSGGAKLELILCGGQQAYWVPGILTYSYHRHFIWHACTLCDFFFVLFVFQCCTGLWKGKCFTLCCCHRNRLCQCPPKRTVFTTHELKHGSDFLEIKVVAQIDR